MRRLRIGYVSADFNLHSAAATFGAALLHYDREGFKVFCYANNRPDRLDAVTERFRKSVDHWRTITDLDDDAVVAQIQRDRIDILVDLSGHSTGHRLGVFARKPAPVQCTGWGYICGVGLPAIDYLVIDPVILPESERPLFTEQVLDLPCGVHLQPLGHWPEVGPLPALEKGYLTFGAFHRSNKLQPEVLDLWARLLLELPEARLLIKLPKERLDYYEGAYRQALARRSVDPARLEVRGATVQWAHLDTFNEVDISLDPFPHGGGVTALESLRMGVPVLAYRVESITGRLSASFCRTLGLEDWVAHGADDYLAIAKAQEKDLYGLARLREGLRRRFDDSILGNHALYMDHLQGRYREMWRRWCGVREG